MRRVALVVLALAIIAVGAGMFIWSGQTPVAAAKTQPVSAPSDLNLTQNTAAPQNATDILPATSVQYDSSAEEQMTNFSFDEHECGRGGSAHKSGY